MLLLCFFAGYKCFCLSVSSKAGQLFVCLCEREISALIRTVLWLHYFYRVAERSLTRDAHITRSESSREWNTAAAADHRRDYEDQDCKILDWGHSVSMSLFYLPKQAFQSIISVLCTKQSYSVYRDFRMEQRGTNFKLWRYCGWRKVLHKKCF